MKKKDLFAYLDAFYFVEPGEVEMAIADFYRDFIEKDENYQPSWGELAFYSELASEYLEKKGVFLPF